LPAFRQFIGAVVGANMRGTLGVAVALLVAMLASIAVASVPAAAAGSDPRSEADWILSAQLPSGAIASHADRTFVSPYLAAYAAVGLSDATRTTGDPRYAQGAWRAVEWHASVMDSNGYVTDYRIENTNLVSTGSADSTDAYAGMFLVGVDAAFRAAPNVSLLRAIAPQVRAAVSAVRSTQRVDGLTGAKPSYMVAYLMNQAEAFAGLTAAARLALILGDPLLARDARVAAGRIQAGVEQLWNPTTGAYDWASHPDGAHQTTNWSQLYPDAVSQVWAVRFGVARSGHAHAILAQFLETHPHAYDPSSTDLVNGTVGPTGYWPGLALALQFVDPGALSRFLAGTRGQAAATARAWPYSVQIAADSVELIAAGA
jgi:hypothetical protein